MVSVGNSILIRRKEIVAEERHRITVTSNLGGQTGSSERVFSVRRIAVQPDMVDITQVLASLKMYNHKAKVQILSFTSCTITPKS